MLDVDVRSPQLYGVGYDRIDQLDDRRVHPGQLGGVFLLLLHFFDADRLIELLDEAVDHGVWTKRLLNELVQLAGRAEQRGDFAAGRPAHALNRFLVQGIRHCQVHHPAVHLDREHVVLAAKLFRQDLHRVLVDSAGTEVDVIDAERVLDDLGDLLEGEYVPVDQCLRYVWFLLEPPPLDQFGRDARHGPDQGDQPLVLEAEFSLVRLRVSRYRHVFRCGYFRPAAL